MSVNKLISKMVNRLLKKGAKTIIKQLIKGDDNDIKVGDDIVVTNQDGSRIRLKVMSMSGNLVQLSDGTVRDLS